MKTPFFFTLIFSAAVTFGQPKRNPGTEAYQLKNFLLKMHISPRVINDDFSKDVWRTLLRNLDPASIYFSSEHINALASHTFAIDNEINNAEWKFCPDVSRRYLAALKEMHGFLTNITPEAVMLDGKDSFGIDQDEWLSSADLASRRIQWFKFELVQKIGLMAVNESTTGEELKRYFEPAFAIVKKSEIQNIERILNTTGGLENLVAISYFQTVATVFDPHTVYLSHKDVNNFIGQLATEDYFFGFTIGENEAGEVAIVALAPGGPAWKSGEIHVSDVLLSTKGKDSKVTDFTGISEDEASLLLDIIDESELEFRIRKKDGVEKNVKLRKEKMHSEESAVRSFVLSGAKKVGYIHLPDFYTKWESDTEGSRCANDVAKEIFKLKRDGIDALILDVRFNGGGSLYEAMAMIGIFIDEGPVGVIKDHRQKVTTLKDVNRGTIYDGPLILMVNGQSASASEVLAAAIQDYNRGLIIGGQTYGKATGQQIFPVSLNGDDSDVVTSTKNEGAFVKVTTERLYRITGQSVQGLGVTPDLSLPDIFEALDFSESDNDFFLQPDSLEKKSAYKPLPKIDRSFLRERSAERVKRSTAFSTINNFINKTKSDQTRAVCLCWAEVGRRQVHEQPASSEEERVFEVQNNSIDERRFLLDDYAREFNAAWKSRLTQDIWLHETFLIASDLVDLKSP